MPLVLNPPVGLSTVALVVKPAGGRKKSNQDYLLLTGRFLQGTQKKGFYGFPGGGVEPGETIGQAILREIREETGLITAPLSPRIVCRPVPGVRKLSVYVLLTPVGGKLRDTSEMDQLRFRHLSHAFTDQKHPERLFRNENRMAYECFRNYGELPGGRCFTGFAPKEWSVLPAFPPDDAYESFMAEQAA